MNENTNCLTTDSKEAEIKQKVQDHKKEINRLVSLVRRGREESLEMLFSKIPDRCLDAICATAEQYNEPMLGGVYFIKNEYNDMIKIGYANNIKDRFAQLKGSFLLLGMEPKLKLIGVVLTFKKYMNLMENYFHQEFKEYRVIGEWFKVSVEDIESVIFPCTDQWDVIGGVFVDYTDYEYEFFKNIPRTYAVSDDEIREMHSIDIDRIFPFDYLGRKGNKLSKTLEVIERNKVGFHDVYYPSQDEGGRMVGVKHLDSDLTFNFQGLKRHKFNGTDWEGIICSINAIKS